MGNHESVEDFQPIGMFAQPFPVGQLRAKSILKGTIAAILWVPELVAREELMELDGRAGALIIPMTIALVIRFLLATGIEHIQVSDAFFDTRYQHGSGNGRWTIGFTSNFAEEAHSCQHSHDADCERSSDNW